MIQENQKPSDIMSNSTTVIPNPKTAYNPYLDYAFMDAERIIYHPLGSHDLFLDYLERQGCMNLMRQENRYEYNYDQQHSPLHKYCESNHIDLQSGEEEFMESDRLFIKDAIIGNAPLGIVPKPFADAVIRLLPKLIYAAQKTGMSYCELFEEFTGRMVLPNAVVFCAFFNEGTFIRIYKRPTEGSMHTALYLPSNYKLNPDFDFERLNDDDKSLYLLVGILLWENYSNVVDYIDRGRTFPDSYYGKSGNRYCCLPYSIYHLDSPYLRELVENKSLTPKDINIKFVKNWIMLNGEYI